MFGGKGVFMSTGLAAAQYPGENQGQECYWVWERHVPCSASLSFWEHEKIPSFSH